MIAPLSSRERTLAVATGIVIFIALLVSQVGLPLWDRVELLQQQAGASGEKIARLRKLADNRPSIERKHRQYAPFFSEASDERLQGELLDALEQLAASSQLQLNLKPLAVQRDGRVTRCGVEVEVDGEQGGILDFLDRLLNSPDLIEVDRLRFSTSASRDLPLRATLVVTKIVLRQ